MRRFLKALKFSFNILFSFLFLALNLAPGLQAFVPEIVPVCAACEATGHELCAAQQHDCSTHAVKQESCCDGQTAKAACPTRSREKIGHKCPLPQSGNIAVNPFRFLKPHPGALPHFEMHQPMKFFDAVPLSFISHKKIDRPPTA